MVYFIQLGNLNFVKIGFSKDKSISMRLNSIQTHLPLDLNILLIIPGSLKDEKFYHSILSSHKIRGEWFNLTDDLMSLVESKRHLHINIDFKKKRGKYGKRK